MAEPRDEEERGGPGPEHIEDGLRAVFAEERGRDLNVLDLLGARSRSSTSGRTSSASVRSSARS